jgi:hypothetical protein
MRTDLKFKTGKLGFGASCNASLCLKMTSAMLGM